MSAILNGLSGLTDMSSTVQSDVQTAEQGASVAYVIIALELGIVIFLLFRILHALK